MAYFGANKSPQQPARLLLFNPKEGEREGKKKKQGKKTPGIAMATCSFLALQNLKVPTSHLSVAFDQAAMTVGITTCYECWMLMERGCASKQVAGFRHPPSGQPEPRVPPWAALQRVAVRFWEAGPSPGQGMAIALPSPSVQMGSVRARPHLAGDTTLPGGCWCKPAAARLLAASLTLPLPVINPPLVQGKTPPVALSTT